MGSSFQEQLLKLGLVNKDQVAKAKKDKHQKSKKKSAKRAPAVVDENRLLAEQAQEKKRERARQLNKEREEKLRRREESARIRQLIEQHRLAKEKAGMPFRFVDRGKIYRVFVTESAVDSLSRGSLGIVRLGEEYEVCPAPVVQRIGEIDSSLVVLLNEKQQSADDQADDPYAGYEVPDDLMW